MSNNMPQFRSVSSSAEGEDWKPQATEQTGFWFDPTSSNNLRMGFLKKVAEDIATKYGPMTKWVIHTVNLDQQGNMSLGPVISVIEDTSLGLKRDSLKLNDFVRIEYKGRMLKKETPKEVQLPNGQMMPTQPTKTNSFHNWDVQVWDTPTKSYAQLLQEAGIFEAPKQPAYQQPAPPVQPVQFQPSVPAPAAPAHPQFQQHLQQQHLQQQSAPAAPQFQQPPAQPQFIPQQTQPPIPPSNTGGGTGPVFTQQPSQAWGGTPPGQAWGGAPQQPAFQQSEIVTNQNSGQPPQSF